MRNYAINYAPVRKCLELAVFNYDAHIQHDTNTQHGHDKNMNSEIKSGKE